MKKKIKKRKRKLVKRIKKLRKKQKTKFKKRIRRHQKIKRRFRKITKRKKTKKLNLKKKRQFGVLFAVLKKIKVPNFNKQRIKIKKISFQNIINFMLRPIFSAYEDFREKRKIKKLKKIALEKKEKEKQIKEEQRLRYEIKKQELRDEVKLARERSQDLKKFIREEQAILRREQAKKRHRFLEEIRLEKKIESFRKRELKEIKSLEILAFKEQREDYRPVEARLEKIKEKYRLIREQKIRERVQSLGVEILDTDTKDDLLKKEKEYAEHRQNIEIVLESFYRAANSLVFQLNKRYIPKHKSILRVIDRRYEENLCFIRYDDSPDEEWLALIYLEDSNPAKETIIVEDKTNPEKYMTRSFKTKDIFTYSDFLVDIFTTHLDREFKKKKAS